MATCQMAWDPMDIDRNTCYICYARFERDFNDQPQEYRKRVMESCTDILFSEITGCEFDWNLIICNDDLPFCHGCWNSIEKIFNLNKETEQTDKAMEQIILGIAMKVLLNRKYLKKKGLATSKKDPISPFNGVKVEGYIANQIKCRLCHNVFSVGDYTNLYTTDMSVKITECVEKHLFPELFDENFFDWKIPFYNLVPFCGECSTGIKSMIELDEKLSEIEDFVSSNVDMFTLTVLKCRKKVKKSDRRAFRRKNKHCDDSSIADSIDSQDTVDFDDDCQIIDETNPDTDIYPSNFAEPRLDEPPEQLMEQSTNFATLNSIRSGYNEDPIQIEETVPLLGGNGPSIPGYSFANGNQSERPNSAETCVIPAQTQISTDLVMTDQANLRKEGTLMTVPLSTITKGNGTNGGVVLVTTAQPPSAGGSGTETTGGLRKCPTCTRLFVHTDAWNRHKNICHPGQQTGHFDPEICSEMTSTDEDEYNIHLVSQQTMAASEQSDCLLTRSQSQTSLQRSPPDIPQDRGRRAQSQTLEETYSSEPTLLEYQCDYCPKRCRTKAGLNLHTHIHTKTPYNRAAPPTPSISPRKRAASQSLDDYILGEIPQEYQCDYCPKRCRSKRGLSNHMNSHTNIPHNPAQPSTSSRNDRRSQSQTREDFPQGNVSEGTSVYSCDRCPKRCNSKNGLKLHVQSHSKKATLKCCLCSSFFRYPIELKAHLTKSHSENPSQSNKTNCSPASKVSRRGVTDFACPFCPFPVSNRRKLMAHVQSHYDIAVEHRCEVCKVVFSSKRSLGPHNKSFHSQN